MYDIRELARAAGVTVSSIHRYTGSRLLESPVNRGPNTVYGEDHFVRLLAIKALRGRGHSLPAIREKLASASTEEIFAIAGLPKPPREIDPREIEEAHARAVAQAQAEAQAQAQAEARGHGHAQGRIGAYRLEIARAKQGWTRLALCPGIELHVSAAADDEALRVAAEIEAIYAR